LIALVIEDLVELFDAFKKIPFMLEGEANVV
jgi:hypothetical protein